MVAHELEGETWKDEVEDPPRRASFTALKAGQGCEGPPKRTWGNSGSR